VRYLGAEWRDEIALSMARRKMRRKKPPHIAGMHLSMLLYEEATKYSYRFNVLFRSCLACKVHPRIMHLADDAREVGDGCLWYVGTVGIGSGGKLWQQEK